MDRSSDKYAKQTIWQTFDEISPAYDRVNQVLSLGLDSSWRKQLVRQIVPQDVMSVLDLATGTADLLIRMLKSGLPITRACGIDLSEKMLAVGRKKLDRLRIDRRAVLRKGDMHQIPFTDGEFDAVTAAFALRNAEDPVRVFREINRVLKPGGQVLILEFSLSPRPFLKKAQLVYLERIVPWLGGLVSRQRPAYQYLCETIKDFPAHDRFCALLRETGFVNVEQKRLFPDVTSVYSGRKAAQ